MYIDLYTSDQYNSLYKGLVTGALQMFEVLSLQKLMREGLHPKCISTSQVRRYPSHFHLSYHIVFQMSSLFHLKVLFSELPRARFFQ